MPPGQRKAAAGTSAAARSVGITFDPSKEVLVLDYKGLSALPYSSESLFKSFRAFIFPKGKFVHSPRALARYFVLGKYRVSTALTLVTFAETSNREPELLLNFVQSADCQDVMLETVQTPLKISSGVYQKATRISAIDAVTGFMAIDMSTTPWSTDLSAYLKTIEQFRSLKITNATEMLTHISKPLETRITSTLKTRAELALRAETDALAKQDAAIADETNARHSAKLDALVASMIEHNPGAYDALLSSRITCVELLDAPASAEQVLPAWLSTPLREQLNAGTAAGPRTRFGSPMRRPDAMEPEAEAEASGAAPTAADGQQDDDDDDGDDDDDDDDDEGHLVSDDEQQPPKRARTTTDRFEAGPASGKGKTTKQPNAPASAKGKGKGKQPEKSAAANLKIGPGVDPNAPFGRNRNGKPYKRACGAYQKNMHEAASLARSNTDAKAAASITQLLDANSKLNDELREALTELAKMKAAGSSAVEVAQLREQAKGHEAYHKAYMEGLEKGIAMATGHATRIPASASSI